MKFQSLIARLTAAVFSALLIAFVLVSCNKKNEVVEPKISEPAIEGELTEKVRQFVVRVNKPATDSEMQNLEKVFISLNQEELKAFTDQMFNREIANAQRSGDTDFLAGKEDLKRQYDALFSRSIQRYGKPYNKLTEQQLATIFDETFFKKEASKMENARVAGCQIFYYDGSVPLVDVSSSDVPCQPFYGLMANEQNLNDCDYIYTFTGGWYEKVGTTDFWQAVVMKNKWKGLSYSDGWYGDGTLFTEVQVGNGIPFSPQSLFGTLKMKY